MIFIDTSLMQNRIYPDLLFAITLAEKCDNHLQKENNSNNQFNMLKYYLKSFLTALYNLERLSFN